MSMISTGWPWPAVMFTRRPSATRLARLPPGNVYSSTNSRTRRLLFAAFSRSSFEISLSKWPAFARTTPSFIAGKCAAVTMSLQPVAETMKSASRTALRMGRTSNPSMEASIAFTESTSDDDPGAHSTGSHRDPAPRPSVARDDESLAGDEQVRRIHQAVERALARPVPVVKQVLHLSVVHIDDGKPERAIPLHRSEPDDARRRLLVGSPHPGQDFLSFRVQEADQVGAVVDDEVRLQVEDLVEVRVVLLVGLPLLCVHLEAVGLRERRRHAIVRGQGITRGEAGCCARLPQRQREDPGLRLDVEGHPDPEPSDRFLLFELVPDGGEDGHVVPSPFDPAPPGVTQLGHRAADARKSISAFRYRHGFRNAATPSTTTPAVAIP